MKLVSILLLLLLGDEFLCYFDVETSIAVYRVWNEELQMTHFRSKLNLFIILTLEKMNIPLRFNWDQIIFSSAINYEDKMEARTVAGRRT